MHRMHIAAAVLMAAALTGCEIPRPPNDYEVCNSYGLSPGQDGGFAQCMGEREGRRMQATQFLLSRQPQPYAVPYTPINVPFRGPTNTTCMRMGGGMYGCNSN